jgi:hypothetical protein
LIQDARATGVPKDIIEQAIKTDDRLALLGDLVNLDKHGKPRNRQPSDIPISNVSGVSHDKGGWRLSLTITHKQKSYDGLDFASEVVSAWKRHLDTWRLS